MNDTDTPNACRSWLCRDPAWTVPQPHCEHLVRQVPSPAWPWLTQDVSPRSVALPSPSLALIPFTLCPHLAYLGCPHVEDEEAEAQDA